MSYCMLVSPSIGQAQTRTTATIFQYKQTLSRNLHYRVQSIGVANHSQKINQKYPDNVERYILDVAL